MQSTSVFDPVPLGQQGGAGRGEGGQDEDEREQSTLHISSLDNLPAFVHRLLKFTGHMDGFHWNCFPLKKRSLWKLLTVEKHFFSAANPNPTVSLTVIMVFPKPEPSVFVAYP